MCNKIKLKFAYRHWNIQLFSSFEAFFSRRLWCCWNSQTIDWVRRCAWRSQTRKLPARPRNEPNPSTSLQWWWPTDRRDDGRRENPKFEHKRGEMRAQKIDFWCTWVWASKAKWRVSPSPRRDNQLPQFRKVKREFWCFQVRICRWDLWVQRVKDRWATQVIPIHTSKA